MTSKNFKKRLIRNPLEAVVDAGDITGIAKGVGKSLVNELALDGGRDFLNFLGMDVSSKDKKKSGGHAEQTTPDANGSIEIVDFKMRSLEEKAKNTEQRVEAAIDYHRDVLRSGERISKQEIHALSSQVEEIKMELKSLVASSKELQMEFSSVTMEQAPATAGVYHTNFFEWMVTMIREARKKVEESSSWLNAAKGKKDKKGYWGMFKKHGTSFALSNERGVATQVG